MTVPKDDEDTGLLTTRLRAGWLALALWTAGCQTYRPDVAVGLYEQGDFEGAWEEIADPPWHRGHHDHDRLIWLLEEAKVLRDLGRFEESSDTFEAALALFRDYVLLSPDVSVSEELKGLLGSQVLRDYRGSFADAILATTLVALNDLALGHAQNARAAATQSYEWQKEARIHFEEELQRADELARERELDREAILATPEVQAELDAAGAYVNEGYADYLNPFASFVAAIAHFAAETTADQGVLALEEVAEMVPGNSHVARLLDGSQAAADGTVYLIYERGMAPARKEFRVTVPAPSGVTSVAIPVLRPRPDPASHLRVTAPDGSLELVTEPLVSVDGIIAAQFRHDLPGIIVRTVISTVAKEVGGYAVNRAVRNQSPWVRVFTWIGVNAAKAASSGADIRTWQTLGKEFQVAVFTLPADGTFDVQLIDQGGRPARSERVTLTDAPITVVAVRSIGLQTLRVLVPREVPRP